MPRFTTYDGTELSYRTLGVGEALLVLPGGPMPAADHLGDLGGLAAHRTLFVLEPRGTGGSAVPAGPASHRCDRQVADVEAFRAHLGLDRADLLGHSAGADLATLYAAAHPERIRSLVLVAPGGRAPGVAVAAERSDRAGAKARDAHGAFAPENTGRALRELTAPVLVLAGAHDPGPTPEEAAELAACFPHGELAVQPAAGHFPWLDDAGAFLRQVLAFLDPAVRTVTVDGVRLAYRVTGPEDAEPVVLVHGRGADGTDWAGIAAELSADRRVYALDLRGHGLSDRPGHYGFGVFRDELSGFLKALGLTAVTVVGHSMGAGAACLLAQREPDLIGRLVLEEPPSFVPLDPPRGPAAPPAEPVALDWGVVGATDAELNAPDPAWREELGKISAPTLIVGGGASSHLPQDQVARLAELVQDGLLMTIKGGGHLVHANRPAKFLAAIRKFGV
ncbi:alpha/beta fold hydrolase [Streptomyces sp. NPDC101191]|uniref:alpha/beta fold hydrolase n=1 Tax=Streptomyces sp. NPDC101191 TaxID=3366126 RepID=UPI0037F50702